MSNYPPGGPSSGQGGDQWGQPGGSNPSDDQWNTGAGAGTGDDQPKTGSDQWSSPAASEPGQGGGFGAPQQGGGFGAPQQGGGFGGTQQGGGFNNPPQGEGFGAPPQGGGFGGPPNGGYMGPPPQKSSKKGCIIAAVVVGVLGLLGLLLVIFLFVIAARSVESTIQEVGSSIEAETTAPTTAAPRIYPGRPDIRADDREGTVGQNVVLEGATVKVNSVTYQQSLGRFYDEGYAIVNVTLTGTATDDELNYSSYDFRLLNSSGQLLNSTGLGDVATPLENGSLTAGASATGNVVFEVGAARGDYYLIFEGPSQLTRDFQTYRPRAVVKVTV